MYPGPSRAMRAAVQGQYPPPSLVARNALQSNQSGPGRFSAGQRPYQTVTLTIAGLGLLGTGGVNRDRSE